MGRVGSILKRRPKRSPVCGFGRGCGRGVVSVGV